MELVKIAETLQGGEGHLARANYKLSILYGEMGKREESEECKSRAIDLRTKIRQGLFGSRR
jgi:hypothetical protein